MKSKPKSIRFDEEKLEFAKIHLKKDSAQKVVDHFLDMLWWRHNQGDIPESLRQNPISEKEAKQVDEQIVEEIEKKQAAKFKTNPSKTKEPISLPITTCLDPMPIKEVGEDALDFAVRKNEWKKRQNK
jgi:hypothetical protein